VADTFKGTGVRGLVRADADYVLSHCSSSLLQSSKGWRASVEAMMRYNLVGDEQVNTLLQDARDEAGVDTVERCLQDRSAPSFYPTQEIVERESDRRSEVQATRETSSQKASADPRIHGANMLCLSIEELLVVSSTRAALIGFTYLVGSARRAYDSTMVINQAAHVRTIGVGRS